MGEYFNSLKRERDCEKNIFLKKCILGIDKCAVMPYNNKRREDIQEPHKKGSNRNEEDLLLHRHGRRPR